MNERITLVSLFDEESIKKINNHLNKLKKDLCKVPYGKNVDNRKKVDTLPIHFTIFAWDISDKEIVIKRLNNISFPKIKIRINSIEIMKGKKDSYILYFNIVANKDLCILQKKIYEAIPSEKYNPDNYNFHITIHIDKEYNKILEMKEMLEKNFEELELSVIDFGLYSIYPAKIIKKF